MLMLGLPGTNTPGLAATGRSRSGRRLGVVEVLLARGESVRVIDNLGTRKARNLDTRRDQIEFVQGDICDVETVAVAMQGVERVIHRAAFPSVARYVSDPMGTNRANVERTLNVLLQARAAGVVRFVYAGSSSVYGASAKLPKSESDPGLGTALAQKARQDVLQSCWRERAARILSHLGRR